MPLTEYACSIGRYIVAPIGAALLADYADVIRIEAPGGNDDRFTVPVEDGSGAMFMQMARGKCGA